MSGPPGRRGGGGGGEGGGGGGGKKGGGVLVRGPEGKERVGGHFNVRGWSRGQWATRGRGYDTVGTSWSDLHRLGVVRANLIVSGCDVP